MMGKCPPFLSPLGKGSQAGPGSQDYYVGSVDRYVSNLLIDCIFVDVCHPYTGKLSYFLLGISTVLPRSMPARGRYAGAIDITTKCRGSAPRTAPTVIERSKVAKSSRQFSLQVQAGKRL